MAKFGIAQPVRRVEDPRLLSGHGRYTDDVRPTGVAAGVVVRSPHAAARIVRIDASAVRGVAGVLAIFTGADLKADGIGGLVCETPVQNRAGTPMATPPHPLLADGYVRHVGDPVAFVVGETVKAAKDGAEKLVVDYDVLPSITDLAHAMDDGQPEVWPGTKRNVCFDWSVGDRAKVEELFAKAAHVTRLTVINNCVIPSPIEPRAAVAEYDTKSERFTLTTNTQGGWGIKEQFARNIFHVEPERFRVITPDVGGGFGMKGVVFAEQAIVCYAARKVGRPVRWLSERAEAFVCDTHGRDNVTTAELASDATGKFLAFRTRNMANMGAYLSSYGPYIPTGAGTKILPTVYTFQAVYANVLGIFTNTVPVDAYRGAGRPESNYVMERVVDAAARELGIDRIELRKRNMIERRAMPYTSTVGETYDSGDFAHVLDTAIEKSGWREFGARRAASARRGKKRGIGLAYYIESTMGDPSERAEIRFAQDGYVDVYVGTQSTGQGHETAYVQIIADRLGVPGEKVRVRQGDTDAIPTGGGTGGSRSLYSEGQAILLTAATVIEKGKQAAADALEAAVADITFVRGRFSIVGTDREISLLDLAAQQRARKAAGEAAVMLDAAEVAAIEKHTFPNGCHVAEVEVDPETGVVDILRYLVCDDFGNIVNPMILRGQIQGGVMQGIGQAMLERTVYDADSGQLLSGSFMDYAMPRADDAPDIEVDFIGTPCTTNPLGVKGAGEAGSVGSAQAVVSAVIDALSSNGVSAIDMPMTPERVWEALAKAQPERLLAPLPQ